MLNRLKKYIDYKGISISAFERSIGMSNASFGKTLKQGKGIGSDKLENILRVYSDLNPDWLLTGKGKMLREKEKSLKVEEDAASYGKDEEIKELLDLNDEEMKLLDNYIEKRIIEVLKNVKLKIE